jgi:hypothetical protein
LEETLSSDDMRQFWLDLASVPLEVVSYGYIRAEKAGAHWGDCPIEAVARVRFPTQPRISGAHVWGSALFGEHWEYGSNTDTKEFVQDMIWAADVLSVNGLQGGDGTFGGILRWSTPETVQRRRVYRRILDKFVRDSKERHMS